MTSPDFIPHLPVPASTLNEMKAITDARAADWTTFLSAAWTTTGTAPVLGNGTLTCLYKMVDDTVELFYRLIWGSTTTGGTGTWRFALPIHPVSSSTYMGGYIFDSSATLTFPCASKMNNGTDLIELVGAHNSTGTAGILSATFPMTFATSDTVTFGGIYRGSV